MSKKMVAVVAVLVFLLAGAAVFGFLMWKNASDMKPAPVELKPDSVELEPVFVSLTVNAEGWSEETSSPIPLHITGRTYNKEKVDEKYFVGKSDKDFALKPGSYEIEVYASPVTEAGGMYRVAEPVKIDISKDAIYAKCKCSPSADIALSPIPANEITDDEIEKAQAAMKEAGLSEEEINTFVDVARKARQAKEEVKDVNISDSVTLSGTVFKYGCEEVHYGAYMLRLDSPVTFHSDSDTWPDGSNSVTLTEIQISEMGSCDGSNCESGWCDPLEPWESRIDEHVTVSGNLLIDAGTAHYHAPVAFSDARLAQ